VFAPSAGVIFAERGDLVAVGRPAGLASPRSFSRSRGRWWRFPGFWV